MKREEAVSTEAAQPISMPDELKRFIQRDTYSLLIKGYAGTGKTTLALTILRSLGSSNNFFYISTRISPNELFSYYPWLAAFTRGARTSLVDDGASDNDRTVTPTFEDARLDEPESLFERITNQLMDIKSPIIIIDSWDAIASFMDKEGRLNNERVLQTWRERAGAKLIFISEHPDDTTLDFLVGGVVELRQRQYDNARYREIILHKLRGVRIDRPSYVFTLENSMFRSFDPFVLPKADASNDYRPYSRKEPANIMFSNLIRSGYVALDSALGGGFPRNGIVLIEYDERLSLNVAMSFMAGLVSTFTSTDNPVLIQPCGRMGPREIVNILIPTMPRGKSDLVKILWPKKFPPLSDNIVVQAGRTASEATIARLKKEYEEKLLLNVIAGYAPSPGGPAGKRELKAERQGAIASARACDLSVVLVNSSHRDQFEYFSGIADALMKLLMINNTLILHPVLPSSTLYAIEYDRNAQIDLHAIV
jgi:KaiC/GvpD/RAD55 family RecA-like ATPase